MHADLLRQWYEVNRETFFDRHWPFTRSPDRNGVHADEYMLRLIGAVFETANKLPK